MPFIDRAVLAVLRRGQVLPSQEIYSWIKGCASDRTVETIVELGTYTGLGTTRAILEGLRANSRAVAFGLEIDPKLARVAAKNVSKDHRFRVINGSLITADQLDSSDLTEHEEKWLSRDLEMLNKAPRVHLNQLPSRIDLLVSDGGEFGGMAELMMLLPLCSKFIVLDDILVRKNRSAFDFLRGSEDWQITSQSTERNGTALFTKRSF